MGKLTTEIERVLATKPEPEYFIDTKPEDLAAWPVPDMTFNDKPILYAEDKQIWVWVYGELRVRIAFFVRRQEFEGWFALESHNGEPRLEIADLQSVLESLENVGK